MHATLRRWRFEVQILAGTPLSTIPPPMIRKLASIHRVASIESIQGADAIELARIQGWQCVVKKGEFCTGDRGVFFEIDSQPPDTPVFSFLWTPKNAEEPVP